MSDTMPQGRELDALVAEKLDLPRLLVGPQIKNPAPPAYSTSWDAMRLVVERLVALGYDVDTSVGPNLVPICGLVYNGERDGVRTAKRAASAKADTLPHAVALAALAALKAVEAQHGK